MSVFSNSRAILALLFAGISLSSCGNDTRHKGRTVANADINPLKPGCTSGDCQSSDAVVKTNEGEVLKGLIDKERDERIAEDDRINKRIDELAAKLEGLSQLVVSEIARLDQKDIEILAQLTQATENLTKNISDLDEDTQKKLADLADSMAEELAGLDAKLKAQAEATKAEFAKTKDEMKTGFQQMISAVMTPEQVAVVEKIQAKIEEIQKNRSIDRLVIVEKVSKIKEQFVDIKDDYDPKFVELKKKLAEATAELATFDVETDKLIDAVQIELQDHMEKYAKDQKEELMAEFEAVRSTMTAIEEQSKQADIEMNRNFRKAISSANTSRQKLRSFLLAKLNESEESLLVELDNMQKNHESYKEEVAIEFKRHARNLNRFKNHVASTYATKAELKLVEEAVAGLQNTTKILAKDIEAQGEEFEKALNEKDKELRATFAQGLAEVQADVDSLEYKFDKHLTHYRNTTLSLRKELSGKFKHLLGKIYGVRGEMIARDHATRAALSNQIRNTAKRFQFVTSNMRRDLNNKLSTVHQRIDVTNKKLVAAHNDAQRKLADAIAKEQAERQALNQDIQDLAKSLEEVAKVAARADKVSQANAENIKTLNKTLKQHIADTAKKFRLNDAQVASIKNEMQAMRDDYNQKIKNVEKKARELVRDLGADTQKQFAKMAVDVATLNSKTDGIKNSLGDLTREFKQTVADQNAFQKEILPAQEALVGKGLALVDAMNDVHIAFMDALAPDQATAARQLYNQRFKAIAQLYGGHIHTSFPRLDGRDSFEYLALEYGRLMLMGVPKAYANRILFNKAGILSMTAFPGTSALSLLDYRVACKTSECKRSISNWARYFLIGQSSQARAFRDLILRNRNLERAVVIFTTKLRDFERTAKALEVVVKRHGSVNFPLHKIGAILREQAGIRRAMADRKRAMQKLVATQKQFSKDVDGVENQYKSLQNDLNAFENRIEKAVANNTAGITEAFRLLAALANRSGHKDLVDAAIRIGKEVTGNEITPYNNFTPKISLIQHYFEGPTRRTSSSACNGDVVMRGAELQHRRFGNCWVNYRRVKIGDWIGSAEQIKIRAFGSATRIDVKETYSGTKSFDFQNPTANHSVKAGLFEQGVFDMKDKNIFLPYIAKATDGFTKTMGNGSYWGGIKLSLTPYNELHTDPAKRRGATAPTYTIQMYSPIVLDFHSVGGLRTMANTGLLFDQNGDGIKETTGWVSGRQGSFLARDINGNGQIDNGTELFGEATSLEGTANKAENGYKALTQFDTDKNGIINKKDAVFSELLVWSDDNANGISEKSELKPLAETGVTGISVKYEMTSKENRFDRGNDLRYSAKFFGPEQCGSNGCNSYDIYFSTGFLLGNK